MYFTEVVRTVIYGLADLTDNVPNAASFAESAWRRGAWDSVYGLISHSSDLDTIKVLAEGTDRPTEAALARAILRVAPTMAEGAIELLTYGEARLHWAYKRGTETLVEWLDSIELYPSLAEAEAAATDHRVVPCHSHITVSADVAEIKSILDERFPHLTVTRYPELPGGYWDNAYYEYTINPAEFPNQERFIPHTAYDGERWSLGSPRRSSVPTYTIEDGALVQVAEDAIEPLGLIGLPVMGPSRQQVTDALVAARGRYRTNVLSRLRGWTENSEQERNARRERDLRLADSARRFAAFRDRQDRLLRNGGTDDTMWVATLPFVPNGVRASRNWGIEIETGAGRDLSGTPRGWDAKEDGSLESAYDTYGQTYTDPSDCHWAEQHDIESMTIMEEQESEDGELREVEVISDEYRNPVDCGECGWIERDYDDYYSEDCVELVSPILSSMHSRGLKQICSDIEHAPRTDSAGVHVHVEARDLTVGQVRELILGYDHIEHLLEASYDRHERGYCKRRSADELLRIAREAGSPDTTLEALRKGDRYVTVNLQALDHHGTIEFRAMGPKYNYDHLVRWAMFCREMVNSVKNGAKSKDFAKVRTWADVEAIFARFGIEYNLATGNAEVEVMTEAEDLVSV